MSAVIAAAVTMAVATGYTIYSGERSAKMQEEAQKDAKRAALAQERKADEAMNAANRKQPDTMAILSAAQQAAKGGPSGTMLTGPAGVSPNALQLGKTSLLGG